MKKSIRNIFVFDIDGTLMKPSGNKLDDESKSALNIISKFGDVILASARPLLGITNLYLKDEIKIDHIIALNGALTISELNAPNQNPIEQKIVDYFCSNVNYFKNIWLYTKNNWYSNNLGSSEYLIERNAVSFDAVSIDQYRHEKVLKIAIVSDKDRKSIFLNLLSFPENLTITTSNENYIEIQSKRTNKFLAVNNLFARESVRLFSFGDSNNDVELLKNSFFSCAVSNATEHVKSVSLYTSSLKYGKGVLDSVNFITNKFFKFHN